MWWMMDFLYDLSKIIRILTLLIKILPVLFFPELLSIEEIGKYGVIIAIVYLFIYAIGFEFWFIYNRRLAETDNVKCRQGIIDSQNQYYLLHYIILIPFFIILMGDYDNKVVLYSVLILTSYHLTQEMVRILIHLHRHTSAGSVQLMQGVWALLLPFGYIDGVESLFYYTAITALLGLILGFFILYFTEGLVFKSSLKIVLKIEEYRMISTIMLSAILLKLMLFLPRFILDSEGLLEQSGLIIYFQTIAAPIEFITYFFIQAVYIPKLLNKKIHKSDILKEYKKYNLILNIILFIGSLIATIVLTKYILSDQVYFDNIGIAVIILLSVTINSISAYYASINYVYHDDLSYKRTVLISSALMIPIYFSFSIIFTENLLEAMAVGVLLNSIFMLIARVFYSKKVSIT
jgi:hypothetical protein